MKKSKTSVEKRCLNVERSEEEDEKYKKLTPKMKARREPLPMKMRAFPQSFWQEPNTSGVVLPTTCCSPVIEDRESSCHNHVVGRANTDLLFSLFQNLNQDAGNEKQVPVVKRGRPRKVKSPYQVKMKKKEDDPYFTSAIVPVIQTKEEKSAQEQQVLSILLNSYHPGNSDERLGRILKRQKHPEAIKKKRNPKMSVLSQITS